MSKRGLGRTPGEARSRGARMVELFERLFVVPVAELLDYSAGVPSDEMLRLAQWLWNIGLLRIYAPKSAAEMESMMIARLAQPPLLMEPVDAMNLIEMSSYRWADHCSEFPEGIRRVDVADDGDGYALTLHTETFVPLDEPRKDESPAPPAAD